MDVARPGTAPVTGADRSIGRAIARRLSEAGLRVVLAAAVPVGAAVLNPAALPWSLPLLACWSVAPQVAFWSPRADRRVPFTSGR